MKPSCVEPDWSPRCYREKEERKSADPHPTLYAARKYAVFLSSLWVGDTVIARGCATVDPCRSPSNHLAIAQSQEEISKYYSIFATPSQFHAGEEGGGSLCDCGRWWGGRYVSLSFATQHMIKIRNCLWSGATQGDGRGGGGKKYYRLWKMVSDLALRANRHSI
jgi:hypothetical protein